MLINREDYENYLDSLIGTKKIGKGNVRQNNYQRGQEQFFSLQGDLDYIINRTEYSAIVYLDIFNFSNRIKDKTISYINNYLQEFYGSVFPIIDEFGGMIDRVMGDGIIFVVSNIFENRKTITNDIFNDAYYCCKKIIIELSNTDFKSKAAIALGNLYFCKIGNNIYNELTCIGEPLTIVHRLENEASENQILMLEDVPDIVSDKNVMWTATKITNKKLKGFDDKKTINIIELK